MFTRPDRGPLLITTAFDGRGGTEQQTRALADALAERARVTVVTWSSGKRLGREQVSDSLMVLRMPQLLSWSHDHHWALKRLNLAYTIGTGVIAALLFWRRWASALAVGMSPEGLAAAILGALPGRRAVLGAWASGPFGIVANLERSFLAPFWRRALSRADAYVTQTEETADEIEALGVPRERVHVVPNGVDLEAFSPVDDELRRAAKANLRVGEACVSVFLGRFDLRQKRLDLLLQAWALARLGDWRLVLAGDGPDRARVQELAARVAPTSILLGWQDDVRPLLAAADLFVLPTECEGMSGAMVQAMAFGLPGVISRISTHERMEIEGVVLVPNETRAWAAALQELANAGERRALLGKQARLWVERRCDARRRHSAYASLLAVR
jgi:glycosyltransferase involved in cell wall biosynthesis